MRVILVRSFSQCFQRANKVTRLTCRRCKRLRAKIPNSVILNQYSNIENPLAHELTTGPEIIDAILADHAASNRNSRPSSGKVDAIVAGAGTGGTITGVSRAIKKRHNPGCVVVRCGSSRRSTLLL